MWPKPDHLGPEFASQFGDPGVVAAYHHRPAYPEEVIDILAELLVAPSMALDVGAGTGEIARRLVGRTVAIDAVDPSAGMVARGQIGRASCRERGWVGGVAGVWG